MGWDRVRARGRDKDCCRDSVRNEGWGMIEVKVISQTILE